MATKNSDPSPAAPTTCSTPARPTRRKPRATGAVQQKQVPRIALLSIALARSERPTAFTASPPSTPYACCCLLHAPAKPKMAIHATQQWTRCAAAGVRAGETEEKSSRSRRRVGSDLSEPRSSGAGLVRPGALRFVVVAIIDRVL